MKRKLNHQNIPEEISLDEEVSVSMVPPFEQLGLDPRLLQAIAREKYSSPTLIQARAIPLALDGKDILARAKTGSGKTAAYILPILHGILKRKLQASYSKAITALILVPTKELASQVTKAVTSLSTFCSRDIHCVNLAPQIAESAQRALLASSPDIVVTTPSRASHHLSCSTLIVANLTHLVVDEADLVLSYGYEEDFKNLVRSIPNGVQTFLASATLTTEVDTLKGLFCRDPVIIDLQEEEKDASTISQYVVKCAEDEKFLLLFALFKLKLIKGKTIVFVGDVDRCYRVKLYLEQFGIKSCVLNSELPVNSRIHVVEEFNRNVYNIIVATDEHNVVDANEVAETTTIIKTAETLPPTEGLQVAALPSQLPSNSPDEHLEKRQKKRQSGKKDREYGVARGIDFRNVTCVLNFDLPTNSRSYTHRIGRTARASSPGIALSFVIPACLYYKHKPTSLPTTQHDEKVLGEIMQSQRERGQEVKPYHFDITKLEGFKYRVASALKAVSPGAIREARVRELREEMLKSEKLKRHLEENPEDLSYLRHDTELRPAKVMPHMRHVPDYLKPDTRIKEGIGLQETEVVGIGKQSENRIRQARARDNMRRRGKRGSKTKVDPLRSFSAKSRK